MDNWILLNNQAAGRDKLARFIQYLSRALWDTLEKNHCNQGSVEQFKLIEYIFSTFRKLLRFGKCFEVFYSSFKTIHYPDLIIRITLTLAKLSQALFLLSDHIIWLSRSGLFPNSINTHKWLQISNKYWLLAILMNLARDFYEITRLLDLHKTAKKSGITRSNHPSSPTGATSIQDISKFVLQTYSRLLYGHRDVVVDTMKNCCDLFIPLTALGYTKFSPRTIGLFGCLSSLAGLITLIDSRAKLLPM